MQSRLVLRNGLVVSSHRLFIATFDINCQLHKKGHIFGVWMMAIEKDT